MDKLRIRGGKPLHGNVRISGSKNAALPILLAAPLLTKKTVIENIPRLRDIHTTLQLIEILGCPSTFTDGVVTVEPAQTINPEAPYDLVRTMHINIPSVSNRGDDIRELAIHYTNVFCKKYKIPLKGFSPEFLDCLQEYDWPGNVRELVNLMENIIVRAQYDPTLYPKHLPPEIRIRIINGKRQDALAEDAEPARQPGAPDPEEVALAPFDEYKKYTEYRYFRTLMLSADGDIHRACEMSQLGKQSLYRYLRIHGIPTRA